MSLIADTNFGAPQTPAEIAAYREQVEIAIERKEKDARLQEESIFLMQNFKEFIRHAWRELEPLNVFMSNWHIDAICEHLQAISESKLRRLQIWVPPGSMKSRLASVLWPAWEWTHSPGLKYWTGSYDIHLAMEMASYSRDLMLSDWYQERWGHEFKFRSTAAKWITNDQAGHRLSTSPESSGTGKHGHRILVDDAVNALDASAITKATLEKANEWYDVSMAGRGLPGYAEIIIQQRLHQNDFAAHALQFGEWEVLCLPEVYEDKHPFAWRGDPRTEGELLWPARRDWEEHAILTKKLGSKAAGQLQQRPSAREGQVIPRAGWRYYPKEFQEAAEAKDVSKLPKFRSLICSWDTTFKDKNTSDYVAGGIWGVHGSNRYLLKTFHQQASLSATKTAMVEFRKWCLDRWPHLPVRTLIEKSANGVEIIDQLKQEVTGIVPVNASTDKITRAEACEPDFEGENVWVPGRASAANDDYDQSVTPGWVIDVVESCSVFPLGANDDLVDMVTMALNWVRTHQPATARTSSAYRGRARTTLPAAVANRRR